MDRALDDSINDRQPRNYRSRDHRGPPRYPRDGVRKPSSRSESRNIDRDEWLHDRFTGDEEPESRRPTRGYGRDDRHEREHPNRGGDDLINAGTKVRVENFHYDLTEDDLRDLFSRMGSVRDYYLLYDRQDRSKGIGFVTYDDERDARDAIREFNGANASGQPIYVSIASNAPPKPARNPFDYVEKPSRSLFDRIERDDASESLTDREREGGRERGGRGGRNRRRGRSASPRSRDESIRHSDVSKPAPDHIDRYVPPGRRDRRSPLPGPRRGGGGRNGGGRNDEGRRPGVRRDGSERNGGGRGGRGPRADHDEEGRPIVQGRPRKTAEELDAEMNDYWGGKEEEGAGAAGAQNNGNSGAAGAGTMEDDIDMIG